MAYADIVVEPLALENESIPRRVADVVPAAAIVPHEAPVPQWNSEQVTVGAEINAAGNVHT